MNEHSFVKAIHRKLSPDVYKWKIHDTYTGGVPDAMYAGPSGVLFVEYKYVKQLPKRDSTIIRHSLSKLQIDWLERMKHSTKVALILGIEDFALIIVDDFSANISKMKYLELCVPRNEVANWIYQQTHEGVTYEQVRDFTSSGTESKKNLATKKD